MAAMLAEPDTAYDENRPHDLEWRQRLLQKDPSSSLAVRDALRAGFGISLIPYPYVEEDLKAGRLLTALEDWRTVETTLYAVYPSGQHVAPKIRALMTFLSDTFAGRG